MLHTGSATLAGRTDSGSWVHARVSASMRDLASFLGRFLLLFLVLGVADVPIICADERPSDEISGSVVRSADDLASARVSTPGASIDDGVCCFCPCHSSFRTASASELPSSRSSVEVIASPRARGIPGLPHSIDHPPQNLL